MKKSWIIKSWTKSHEKENEKWKQIRNEKIANETFTNEKVINEKIPTEEIVNEKNCEWKIIVWKNHECECNNNKWKKLQMRKLWMKNYSMEKSWM